MHKPGFNPRVETLGLPPIPAVFAWGRQYNGAHGALIDLSQAVPGYWPHESLLRFLGEAAASPLACGYGPIEGDLALRQAYSAHVSALYGASIGVDEIHITAGANQAFLCLAMALAGQGDAIALTNPFYFNNDTSLAMLGIQTVPVACRADCGFWPDIAEVEQALLSGVKALCLVSPNNPTGAVYPPDLLLTLLNACRKYGAWLIVDETYRDFIAQDSDQASQAAPHGLFLQEDWRDVLIQIYSFSKSFAIPGHRLAAIAAGPAVITQVMKVMDNLQICAPRAGQIALAKAISALDHWRRANNAEITRRANVLKAGFVELEQSVPGWHLASCGAYFAFVRHPFMDKNGEPIASRHVAEKLAKEAGILTLPGEFFGQGQEAYLRFAFANADCERLSGLAKRLSDFRPDFE